MWNTGCGWEIGRKEEDPMMAMWAIPGMPMEKQWQRYARTYSERCDQIPPEGLTEEALNTQTFFNDFGQVISGLASNLEGGNEAQSPAFVVNYAGSDSTMQMLAGTYSMRTDCARSEGGSFFGGVDASVCFEGPDSFIMWNTGCGWEIGRKEEDPMMAMWAIPGMPMEKQWQRYARTYSERCDQIPPEGLTEEALNTQTFFNDFGQVISGLASNLEGISGAQCPAFVVNYAGSDVKMQTIAGTYSKRTDCERSEGGSFFGGVDASVCFEGPDSFIIWNTGCGWEIGRKEEDPMMAMWAIPGMPMEKQWQRYARTYSERCDQIPPEGLTTEALNTLTFLNDFGQVIAGLTSNDDPACHE